MKRDEKKSFFLLKNVWEPPKSARRISSKCFEKNPSRTNYSSIFSSKVQNLTVFSIICMIRIRFFGPRGIKSEGVSGGKVKVRFTSYAFFDTVATNYHNILDEHGPPALWKNEVNKKEYTLCTQTRHLNRLTLLFLVFFNYLF